jgi:hypothetical protein
VTRCAFYGNSDRESIYDRVAKGTRASGVRALFQLSMTACAPTYGKPF